MPYYYHTSTRNISFLKMVKTLKDLGVKNNKFMLHLNNLELLNVDPWDKSLSDDIKAAILKECSENFWYFIREVLKWYQYEEGMQHTILNRSNMAMYYLTLQSISSWRSTVRQTYNTKSTLSILTWIYHFVPNCRSAILDFANVDVTKKRFENVYTGVPEFMLEYFKQNNSINTMEMSKNSRLSTTLKNISISSRVTAERADSIGRGLTENVCFYNDAEFITNIESIMDSNAPVFHHACQNGLMRPDGSDIFARIYCSTRAEIGTTNATFASKLISKMTEWDDTFYDYEIGELRKLLTEVGLFHVAYTYTQLGYTNEWFESMCSSLNNKKDAIKRELLMEWA